MDGFDRNEVMFAAGAIAEGDVRIGKGSSVWYNAVIRGDEDSITIGEGTNVQDCCVIHTDTGHPVVIGNGVTIGHGAVVHGCEIGDNSLIGMGAIILNGAKVGKNCIIAAGALLTQGAVVPDGMLAMGSPAKIRRELTEEEIRHNAYNAQVYCEMAVKRMEAEKKH